MRYTNPMRFDPNLKSSVPASPLSPEAFLALGMQHIAYVRPLASKGRMLWAVHAADGSPLTVIDDPYDVVLATVRQSDLMPVSVH